MVFSQPSLLEIMLKDIPHVSFTSSSQRERSFPRLPPHVVTFSRIKRKQIVTRGIRRANMNVCYLNISDHRADVYYLDPYTPWGMNIDQR